MERKILNQLIKILIDCELNPTRDDIDALECLYEKLNKKEIMAKSTLEIKILDLPEVKEVIKNAADRIQALESEIREFMEACDIAEKPNHFKYGYAEHHYKKFKQLLADK